MNDVIGQILGIVATVLTFFSYLANTKRRLLAIQTLSTSFTCLSFLFLGAATGFSLNIVCIVRNVIYYFTDQKSKLYYPATALLAIAMIVLGCESWQGPISLFMIVALVLNTIFISLGNVQLLRKSILLSSSMVLVYNIFVFSIGGMASEMIAIIASIIGIIRYRNAKKQDAQGERP